jgi:hypothetical protein
MKLDIATLLNLSDRFRDLTGVAEEKTLSYRMLGDSKRLGQLRENGEITVGRFNGAMEWLASRWPPETDFPTELRVYRATETISLPPPNEAA